MLIERILPLTIAGKGRSRDFDLLGNVFVRFRPPHEFVDVKTGNEVGLRAGLGYLPPSTRAWIPRRLYAEASTPAHRRLCRDRADFDRSRNCVFVPTP